ncbi:MAG: hypothetical protein INF04_12790 [Phenylobacterium sp.]|nr:hypothetical protein [Phenylobacterium sp.]
MTEAVASPPVTETPFSKNKERYKELVKIIVNESGSYSLDDQLKAFSAQWEMGVKGEMYVGIDPSTQAQRDDAYALSEKVYNSELFRRMDRIQNKLGSAFSIAHERGQNVFLTSLRDLASLSEDDQKIWYTYQNGFDMSGNRQYASFDSYRDQQVKNAQREVAYRGNDPALAQALTTIGSAKSGSEWSSQILSLLKPLDAEAYRGGDPALAQALKTIGSAKSGSEWSSQVLSLFKPLDAEDRVPGQSPAQRLFDVRPSVPSSYEPGNLRARLV